MRVALSPRMVNLQQEISHVHLLGLLMLPIAVFAAGCISYSSLDPYLDRAVGKAVGTDPYPQLKYHRAMSDSNGSRFVEYSIDDLWRCRWVFEIDKSTGNVKSWYYPDEQAKRWCTDMPDTRP